MNHDEHWLEIYKRIMQALIEEKLYQDQHLSLSKIALALGTNVNYVSKAINRCGGENFNALLISIRVAQACVMLKQNQSMTMEEIGSHCGFGSRASFYRGFKNIMGISPKMYAAAPDSYKVLKFKNSMIEH